MPLNTNYLTPPETPGTQKVVDIGPELERLSKAVVHAINARDFEFESEEAQELVSSLAPEFKARVDTRPDQQDILTWAQQVAAWRERAREHPDVQFQVTHISSDVSESKGMARVWMEMEVWGIGSVKLQAMNEVLWRRTKGDKWLCYYVIGMRGTSANSGLG